MILYYWTVCAVFPLSSLPSDSEVNKLPKSLREPVSQWHSQLPITQVAFEIKIQLQHFLTHFFPNYHVMTPFMII